MPGLPLLLLLLALFAVPGSAAVPTELKLHPQPRSVVALGGTWTAPQRVEVLVSRDLGADEDGVRDVLKRRLEAVGLTPVFHTEGRRGAPRHPHILVDDLSAHRLSGRADLALPEAFPPEGYVLEVRQDQVLLAAGDPRGLVYAAVTLGQLLLQSTTLPALRIEDHPVLAQRWAHFQIPTLTTGGESYFDRRKVDYPGLYADFHTAADYLPVLEALVEEALDQKLNGIVIDVNNAFRLRSHPELAMDEAVDIAALDPILARIAEHHAEAVPLLHLLSHQEQLLAPAHPELMLVAMGTWPKKAGRNPGEIFYWNPIYDPRLPEVQAIVRDVAHEVIDRFGARWLHGGHDEAGALRFVDLGELSQAELFADSVTFVAGVAAEKGARLMIWGDMLLHTRRIPGAAHGAEEGTNTWAALGKVPKDVVMVDWQYYPPPPIYPDTREGRTDIPSSQYFVDQGFEVIGAVVNRKATSRPLKGLVLLGNTQSQGFSAFLAGLPPAKGRALGMLSCHFLIGPGHLAPWEETGGAGTLALPGEHFWSGGLRELPEATVLQPVGP